MGERIEIVELTDEHCVTVADGMRPADRREYDAMMSLPRREGLIDMRKRSRRSHAVLVNGQAIMAYGILSRTVLSTDGHPWLVATSIIDEDRHLRREFAMRSRECAAELMRGYSHCSNFCDAKNLPVIRWLKWLGFSFGTQKLDHNGVEFLHFWKDFGNVP